MKWSVESNIITKGLLNEENTAIVLHLNPAFGRDSIELKELNSYKISKLLIICQNCPSLQQIKQVHIRIIYKNDVAIAIGHIADDRWYSLLDCPGMLFSLHDIKFNYKLY